MKENQFDFNSFIDSLPLSRAYPCSYFDERLSVVKAFFNRGKIEPQLLESILNLGIRRSGNIYYQNHCPQCSMCLSYRVVLDRFQLTGSQKRILKRNKDIKVRFTYPHVTYEKESLYIRYNYLQHYLKPGQTGQRREEFDKEKVLSTMYDQMYSNSENSLEMEIFLKNHLVGFAVFDIAVKSLSAVYSVYDVEDRRRSLGTYIILKSIEWARSMNFHYYHLGFYIPGHPKMDYKSHYKNAEIRNPETGKWEDAEKIISQFRHSL
jgi:arginyl-tRNA--protein-N-Asp/Glu arginylyltransferase